MTSTVVPGVTPQPMSDHRPEPPRFRPGARRRTRLAAGAGLAALAIAGNMLAYSSLDRRQPVLQVVRDVPAGNQLTEADLGVVEVSAGSGVRTVAGDDLTVVVGRFAKVRLVAGSLVVAEVLQTEPLVSPGAAVVAVRVPEGALPLGLRERSHVQLVVRAAATDAAPTIVDGRVVGLPTGSPSTTGELTLSVEVAVADAAVAAAGDDVRVVLLEQNPDPADASGP